MSMPIDPSLLGPTTLAVSQAVTSFMTFLPPIADIRKNDPASDPIFTGDVRMGEVAAVTLTVGVGVVVSALTGSSAPAIAGLVVAIGLVMLYESILRADRPLEAKGTP